MGKDDVILMSHGGGGTRTSGLIRDVIVKHLHNPVLARMDDSACLYIPEAELAFTTDSFVVKPYFFPGGDIGRLAACGTINDLAMQASEPRYMSLGLILEEGLPIADLDRIIASMGEVLSESGVHVVTGDTKVVEHGNGSGIYINTAGIGVRYPGTDVHVSNAKPGDAVIVTGTIGDHGIAVLSARQGLNFQTRIVSDAAPLCGLTAALLRQVPHIHCLRDPTRGGLAGALCDIAVSSHVGIRIEEKALPVNPEVLGACRLLGLDPLNVPNEGKAVIICPAKELDHALTTLHRHPLGREARQIGTVEAQPVDMVLIQTSTGGERIVHLPSGEDMPRIC